LDTKDAKKFIQQHKEEIAVRRKVVQILNGVCNETFGEGLPDDVYDGWLENSGFKPAEIALAIRKMRGRHITGGVAGRIKYISGIIWKWKRGTSDEPLPPLPDEDDEIGF
jgi:hypothetical protein